MRGSNFIFCFLFSFTCLGNDIDKLITIKDVNNFLIDKVDKRFEKYLPLDPADTSVNRSEYSRNKFFKVDLDNNGLTDLIIFGNRNLLVILDESKSRYLIRYIDNGSFSQNYAVLISIDTTSSPRKLIVHQGEKPEQQIDTLVFKFNNFIEYNSKPPVGFSFEKLTITTSQCFGTCPIFNMTINENRTATFTAIKYNDESGEFKSIIPEKEFNELVSLLNYLPLENVKNDYAVNWTDDQTVTTESKYNNKSKVISDYGRIGTFGLSALYSMLFKWRKGINWKE